MRIVPESFVNKIYTYVYPSWPIATIIPYRIFVKSLVGYRWNNSKLATLAQYQGKVVHFMAYKRVLSNTCC